MCFSCMHNIRTHKWHTHGYMSNIFYIIHRQYRPMFIYIYVSARSHRMTKAENFLPLFPKHENDQKGDDNDNIFIYI